MSDFSLTLVLQFKTSKIINGMANISIKCEHSKNANQILMCPVYQGDVYQGDGEIDTHLE